MAAIIPICASVSFSKSAPASDDIWPPSKSAKTFLPLTGVISNGKKSDFSIEFWQIELMGISSI